MVVIIDGNDIVFDYEEKLKIDESEEETIIDLFFKFMFEDV